MKRDRIQKIKEYVVTNRTVTLDEICEHFQVSKSTLRRDLREITGDAGIQKSYGVLTASLSSPQLPFEQRHVANANAKRRIAAKAAELVRDNDIIFIDSGTTTLYLVDYVRTRRNLTIITNNIEVIQRAIPYNNITVITLSGVLNRDLFSFSGGSAVNVLSGYNINQAFLATAGIAKDFSITNAFAAETELKKAAIARSTRTILLADSTKFGVLSLYTFCRIEDINVVITDKQPSMEYLSWLKDRDIELITCE